MATKKREHQVRTVDLYGDVVGDTKRVCDEQALVGYLLIDSFCCIMQGGPAQCVLVFAKD